MLNALAADIDAEFDAMADRLAIVAAYSVRAHLANHNLARHPIRFEPVEGLKVGEQYWYEFHTRHPVHATIRQAGEFADQLPDVIKSHLADRL